MRFVDTNVPLYASSLPPEDAEKRLRARELLKGSHLAVSVQVLQEFYHQATRPTRPGRLAHEDALRFLQPVLSITNFSPNSHLVAILHSKCIMSP